MNASDTQLFRYLIETTQFKRKLGLHLPKGFYYYGPEDYVLDHGNPLASHPLTHEERDIVFSAVEASGSRFKIQECFHNAQKVALADSTGTLRYCEGLAMGLSHWPVLHGWVAINGKVVDLTWRWHTPLRKGRLRDRVFGDIPDGWAYHGVTFDTDSVMARWARYGVSFSFLDDFAHGFPIFQEPRIRSWEEIMGQYGNH